MKKICYAIIASALIAVPQCAYATVDTAHSACVMNAATGELIFEKNAYERLPMASTTKIMTAYTALKNCNLQDVAVISRNAQYQDGSAMYIQEGEEYYMEDLLYGLMLNSGNDAAVAIAENISGSSEAFVDLMNQEAWEMGAGDTMFCNPNGLPNDSHFTTARDLALITKYALDIPEFRTIVSTRARNAWPKEPADRMVPLYNHNKLLGTYEGAIGVKTGYTDAAGRCLVSAAERDGMTFIAVTLNDNDDWNTHMQMLDDVFSRYVPRVVYKKGDVVKEFYENGKKYTFSAASDMIIPSDSLEKERINAQIHIASNLGGEINAGEKVGYVSIKYNGKDIGTIDVVSDSDIRGIGEIRLKHSFYEFWRNIWDFFLV